MTLLWVLDPLRGRFFRFTGLRFGFNIHRCFKFLPKGNKIANVQDFVIGKMEYIKLMVTLLLLLLKC